MKTLPLLLLALGLLPGPPAYTRYCNARFGYCLDYPAELRPQPEAANGDGRRFVSADRQTVLTAYAGYDALEGGLTGHHATAREVWRQQQATITLDQTVTGGYVLSGLVKGHIFYQKTVLRAGTFSTFCWEYPTARKAVMDAVVRHTIGTWQPSPGDR